MEVTILEMARDEKNVRTCFCILWICACTCLYMCITDQCTCINASAHFGYGDIFHDKSDTVFTVHWKSLISLGAWAYLSQL